MLLLKEQELNLQPFPFQGNARPIELCLLALRERTFFRDLEENRTLYQWVATIVPQSRDPGHTQVRYPRVKADCCLPHGIPPFILAF